jgi:rare lipoprotein A
MEDEAMLEIIALVLMAQQPFVEPFEMLMEGKASYYTEQETSSITASGERFDDNLFSCAMRRGELGSYVLVVAENGKKVVCRLNDRGPQLKRRVIDLSEAAMRQLDPKAGLLRVKVYKISLEKLASLFNLGTYNS